MNRSSFVGAFARRASLGGLALAMALFAAPNSDAADLPTDPKVERGKLANGMNWLFRQHDNPPGRIGIMLHIETGSLNETDAQRGLAHFIEHMSFNGSQNFPPGTLIPYFESIGMQFGAHVNAFTSFDQTSYMLFLPDTDVAGLDKALNVMSDYAFRVSFVPEEIEKERGVVLSELRSGLSAQQRIREKLWPQLFEGSRFAQRLPIGTAEVLSTAQRDLFEDYYRTWYRPENMTFMVVGDISVDKVKPLIEKWFGEYKPTAPARPMEKAGFKPSSAERALVVSDPEYATADVEFINLTPGRPPTTTVEQARTDLIEQVATWIANRRMREKIRRGEASFLSANTSIDRFFDDAIIADAEASGQPQDWEKMLEEMIIEVKRATEFGFTEREFELARTDILASAERAVRTEPTQNAQSFLFSMNNAVNEGEPIMSAQQELDLIKQLLPQVKLAEVNETFQRLFQVNTFTYIVTLPEKPDVKLPTSDEVLAAARAARARAVEPLKESDTQTDLLAKEPTPGKIVEQTEDKDLGITSAWLDNGVCVHHRHMDYKKDNVLVSISLAGGKIEETAENAGISDVASLAFRQLATKRLNSNQITDLLTGKNIRVGGNATEDTLAVTVSGSPQDLEIGLRLAHALLTEPKIEQSAFDNWRKRTLDRLTMQQTMPEFKAAEAMVELISGRDPRWALPNRERVERQKIDAAQAWLERLIGGAPIEVAVVGEIKLEEAMPLIQKYVGSLPKREREAAHLAGLRKVNRAKGPLERQVSVETQTPKAMVFAGCVGGRAQNAQESRAMELASNVLTSQLIKQIREDTGMVYSISANHAPNWSYEDSSLMISGAPCDPGKGEEVVAAVNRIFSEFAAKGPTADELENARKQVFNVMDTQTKEPSYWFAVLQNLHLHDVSLAEEKRDREAYTNMTAEEVQKTFAKYWTPERMFRVIAVPADVPAGSESPEPKAEEPAGVTTGN